MLFKSWSLIFTPRKLADRSFIYSLPSHTWSMMKVLLAPARLAILVTHRTQALKFFGKLGVSMTPFDNRKVGVSCKAPNSHSEIKEHIRAIQMMCTNMCIWHTCWWRSVGTGHFVFPYLKPFCVHWKTLYIKPTVARIVEVAVYDVCWALTSKNRWRALTC